MESEELVVCGVIGVVCLLGLIELAFDIPAIVLGVAGQDSNDVYTDSAAEHDTPLCFGDFLQLSTWLLVAGASGLGYIAVLIMSSMCVNEGAEAINAFLGFIKILWNMTWAICGCVVLSTVHSGCAEEFGYLVDMSVAMLVFLFLKILLLCCLGMTKLCAD